MNRLCPSGLSESELDEDYDGTFCAPDICSGPKVTEVKRRVFLGVLGPEVTRVMVQCQLTGEKVLEPLGSTIEDVSEK